MTIPQDQTLQISRTNPEVLAVVSNVIRLKRDTLEPGLLNDLREELTRDNPQYHQMLSMKRRNPQKYRYTALPPSTVTSFDETENTILIPRGFRKNLINMARSYNQEVRFIDQSISFFANTEVRLDENLVLKRYQSFALTSMIFNKDGVIVAPCGGGKTVIGVAAICTIRQPTLVLVHTTDLMRQWRDELAKKSQIPGGVAQWGAGIKNLGQVTIGMIQTLIRMPGAELRQFLDNFGYLILDECHHCPADTFLAIVNLSKSLYRHGLTATPKRKDGLEFLMSDTIGPIITEINDSDLEAEGRSQTCSVIGLYTTFYSRYTADEWTQLIGEIVRDSDRNRLIVRNILQSWNDGLFPLVLSDRVAHCTELCNALRENGMNAHVMTGSVPKAIRKQIQERAREGLIDAIVATKVADEGLDIDTLSAVHLTCPTANEGKLKQRIGRIRRPLPGKRSVIYDYIDSRIPSCVRMAQARKRLYRKWGFTIQM